VAVVSTQNPRSPAQGPPHDTHAPPTQHSVGPHWAVVLHTVGTEQQVLPIEQIPVEIGCEPAGHSVPTKQDPSHDGCVGHAGLDGN
jgi:hypothetical protein